MEVFSFIKSYKKSVHLDENIYNIYGKTFFYAELDPATDDPISDIIIEVNRSPNYPRTRYLKIQVFWKHHGINYCLRSKKKESKDAPVRKVGTFISDLFVNNNKTDKVPGGSMVGGQTYEFYDFPTEWKNTEKMTELEISFAFLVEYCENDQPLTCIDVSSFFLEKDFCYDKNQICWSKIVAESENEKDLKIICGDKEFLTHKVIMQEVSPVLQAMYSLEMKENREGVWEIIDSEPEVIQEFLNFIYFRKIHNYLDYAPGLLEIGQKYMIQELEEIFTTIDNSRKPQKLFD